MALPSYKAGPKPLHKRDAFPLPALEQPDGDDVGRRTDDGEVAQIVPPNSIAHQSGKTLMPAITISPTMGINEATAKTLSINAESKSDSPRDDPHQRHHLAAR